MGKNCSKPSKGHKDGQSLLSVLKKMSLTLRLFRPTKKAKGDLIFCLPLSSGTLQRQWIQTLNRGQMKGQKATVQVSKREVKFDIRKSFLIC